MRRHRASMLGAVMVLAALAAGALPAHAVAVSTGTGSGLAGQTVDIDINTASLTGLNVLSLQFTLNYNNTVVTAVDVITPGSMTATALWATPAFYVSNNGSTGTIHVSDAGSAALTGAGSLLKVRFTLNPTLLNGSATGLSLPTFTFNEGTPTATMTGSTLTVNATPQIDVYPDVGEIVRGQTLQFYVSGTPTLPITWTTSNNAIATIASTGLLTGVAPGLVTVTGTDAALHASTTTGQIAVRGMGITAGSSTVVIGQSITLPITVTSLTGLGIRSGQFGLTFNGNVLTATSVTTPAGTLLNGWGSVTFDQGVGTASVAFAGPADLAGAGVLCYVTFSTPNSGGTGVAFSNATFNELLTALKTSGYISVNALPTIYVSPDVQTLLAGQTQQYSVSGSPTNPITWSVDDPTIASISSTGLVTALRGGVTRVRAQDAVGAVDYSTSLTVYDFQLTLSTVTGPPGGTAKVSLTADRAVGGLGIYSMQFKVGWSGTYVTAARTTPSGLWNAWGSGGTQYHFTPNALTVAAGGTTTLTSTSPPVLGSLQFDIAPGTPLGTGIPLTLGSLVFNEGYPIAQVVGGTVQVSSSSGVADPGLPSAFALGRVEPNPAPAGVRIPFALPASGNDGASIRLAIFDLAGHRVRSLIDAPLGPGPHDAVWDGRDDAGQAVRAGLYFTRLEWQNHTATGKLTLVR